MSAGLSLDEACLAIVDCEHKTAPIDPTGGYFAVGTPAMRGNRINYQEARRINRTTFDEWTRRLRPERGDLLLAREAPVGPVVRVPNELNVAPGQRTVLLRPDPTVLDSAFTYYLLASPAQQSRLLQKAEGSTVPHLNVADVRSFELPALPPIEEQRGIAATLGALDDKIESNQRSQVTGEKLIRSLVTAALERSTGEVGVLRDYCNLIKEPARIGALTADLHYIAFEHMPRGSIFLDDWGNAEGLGSDKSYFQVGDILFGKLRPYFKKVGIAPVDGVCSTDILVLRPIRKADTALVAVVASSDPLIDSLSAAATGTRMPRASWKDLASWPVPEMTTLERDELADQVAPLVERLTAMTHETKRLQLLRDTLLPELLSGRIRVPEAREAVREVVA